MPELRESVSESRAEMEQRDKKFLDRIAGLEQAVEKEVKVQKDLRKQVGHQAASSTASCFI